MEMTMRELVNFNSSFTKLAMASLPAKTAYKVAKIQKLVAAELEYYDEQYRALLDEYVQKEENGEYKVDRERNQLILIEGTAEIFDKAFQDLNEVVVEINLPTVSIDELENVEFSPMELVNLLPIIEDE